MGSKYPKGPDSPQPPWCGSIITREEKKYGASLVLPCATKGPRGNPPSTRQNRAEGLCDAASHVTLPFSKKTKNRAAKGLWQITYPPGPPLAEGGRTRFSQFMSKEGRRGFFKVRTSRKLNRSNVAVRASIYIELLPRIFDAVTRGSSAVMVPNNAAMVLNRGRTAP